MSGCAIIAHQIVNSCGNTFKLQINTISFAMLTTSLCKGRRNGIVITQQNQKERIQSKRISNGITKINWYRLEIISFANLKRFQFISCVHAIGCVCECRVLPIGASVFDSNFQQWKCEKQKQTNESIAILSIRWF